MHGTKVRRGFDRGSRGAGHGSCLDLAGGYVESTSADLSVRCTVCRLYVHMYMKYRYCRWAELQGARGKGRREGGEG